MPDPTTYYHDRATGALLPRDECGYGEHAGRINDNRVEHTPESVLPFQRSDDAHPDGCSVCGKATFWESRWLPDGRWQERCSECLDTITTTQ